MVELPVVYDKKYDSFSLNFVENGIIKGYIDFQLYNELYNMVEDYLTKSEYRSYFFSKKTIFLKTLWIDLPYRNRGIAKQLMNEFFAKCLTNKKFKDYDFICLEAIPLDTISFKNNFVNDKQILLEFYKRNGFEVIGKEADDISFMIRPNEI